MAYIGKFREGWRAQIQRNGVRASKTFTTKRLAQAWVIEQEAKETLAQSHTLKEAIDKYVDEISSQKKDGAVEQERRRLGAMLEYFGDVALESITSESIGEWRTERMKEVKGSTVLRDSGLYRNLFRTAVVWGWIDSNPFTGVRLPQQPPARTQVWRWQQIKRVLRAGQRVGGKTLEVTQAFHIALRTAMRLQEAIQAPQCFDSQRRVVDLSHSKTAKKGEIVTVPLTRQGYRLMQTMPAAFEVDKNRASMLFSILLGNLLIKDLQFMDSRATALTLMARKMDILTLARISRHRDLKQLLTYYRESPEDISRRL